MMQQVDSIIKVIESLHPGSWEVYAFHLGLNEKQFRNYDVEITRGAENFGYGIRSINPDGGIGLAPGNSTSSREIEKCLKQAQLAAKVSKSLPYRFPIEQSYKSVKIEDPKIVNDPEIVINDKSEQLISLLKDRNDVTPTFGKLRTYVVDTVLTNSSGLLAKKRETLLYIELALKAALNGHLAEYWPKTYFRGVDDLQLEKRIPEWSQIAVDTLRAKVPKSEKMTLIIPPDIVAELIPSVVGFNASGSAHYKKLSKFTEGQSAAGENITITDDGLHPFGLGTSPFDDEGTAQRITTLIEKGVFKNLITDNIYGPLLEKESTGNGVRSRGSVTDIEAKHTIPVSNGITNISIAHGDMSLEEMIKNTKNGLYVQQFSWLMPDESSGSFGSEIRNARLVEKGEFSNPVKGGLVGDYVIDTVFGDQTIPGLLKRVSGLTKNVEVSGRCIAPYMMFENVQVAGK